MTKNEFTRKISAIVLALTMTLSLVAAGTGIGAIVARADGPVSANITYTAQYDGSFHGVNLNADIASDTAENMGYEDAVPATSGVSLLDVWVQIHKDLYPDYNISNKEEYFDFTNSEWGLTIVRAFHKDGISVGYHKNGSAATGLHDTVTNDDVVDAFFYQDPVNYTDMYTHFADVTSEGGYLEGRLLADTYDDVEGAITVSLANVQIGWLDLDTLELLPASPFYSVTTDASGHFSIESPSTSKKYMLTVYDGNADGKPLVRTLYVKEYSAPSVDTSAMSADEKLNIYNDTGRYLSDNNSNIAYGDNKEDVLLGLGRANYPVSGGLYSGYYDSVKKYLADNNGRFDSVTECAKVVAVLNAIGYDPTNVDGIDITRQLDDSGSVSGVYPNAYALIALDTKGYDSTARETYINNLLQSQLDNGAWGWNGTGADVDTTGMVLAALAPYYNGREDVTSAVNKALLYLSNAQMSDGTFASGLNENSNSTAMVLLGLSELGIDVDTDSRFIKNGISVVDALCAFAVEGGGFGWISDEVINDLSTYQSYYALVSYYRHVNGMNRLFDMTQEKEASTPSKKVPRVPKTCDRIFCL